MSAIITALLTLSLLALGSALIMSIAIRKDKSAFDKYAVAEWLYDQDDLDTIEELHAITTLRRLLLYVDRAEGIARLD